MTTDKPKILFRVDSATYMGAGHVMRCLSLAEALRERGAQCDFVCRDLDGAILEKIGLAGFSLAVLPSPAGLFAIDQGAPAHAEWLKVPINQDLAETKAVTTGVSYDWLVVDHYALDSSWLTPMRDCVAKIAVIDELADRDLDCDLLICQSLPEELIGNKFDRYLPKNAKRLIGPDYVLMRKEFTQWRETSLNRRNMNDRPHRVFVTNGYMDSAGLTVLVLDALEGFPDLTIDIAIGSGSPSIKALQDIADQMTNVVLHIDATNMAELMAKADFAVAGGGSNTFERAALGLPALTVCVAENQRELLEFSEQKGAVKQIGMMEDMSSDQIVTAIKSFISAPTACQAMSIAAAELCDGGGAQRVSTAMLNDV